MSAELILAPKDAEAALDRAVERGAIEEIFVAGVRADAQRLYDEQRGLRESACEMARLVVQANAAIGQVDIDLVPKLAGAKPLVLGGQELSLERRSCWRALGCARERGFLDGLLNEGEDVPSSIVCAYTARRRGYTRVNRTDLERAAQPWIESRPPGRGRPPGMATLAHAAGLARIDAQRQIGWATARRVMAVAGIASLPPGDARKRSGARASGWLKRERKRSGGRYDEAYSRLRLLLDELQRVASPTDARNDHVYAALYTVEDFLGKKLREGAS